MRLDLFDRKILLALDINAREHYSVIARKVGLSKNSVKRRVEALEKLGIIKGYRVQLDVGKLGLMSFRLMLKFQNTNKKIEKKIFDYFKNNSLVCWLVEAEGYWNLNSWFLCKTLDDLSFFWLELQKKFNQFIADKDLCVFIKVTFFPRVFLTNQKVNEREVTFISLPKKVSIDELDKKILLLLTENARMSLIILAQKLSVSVKTVGARIKRMEKEKLIVGYYTFLDVNKLGYSYYKVNINLQKITPELKEMKKSFKFEPNIVFDNELIAGNNLEIEIETDSKEKLFEIVNKIKQAYGSNIKDYQILEYLKEHKFIYFPSYL
ncbi:MAG: AsnC family transcriptional regulator [archaeon]